MAADRKKAVEAPRKSLRNKLTPTALISYHPIAMKKVYLSTAVLIGFVTASLQAGTEVYKQVAAPPPVVYGYGLGFYGAIDMGANIYQDRGDTRVFTGDRRLHDITDRDFDATLTVDPKNDV